MGWFRRAINYRGPVRRVRIPAANVADYREDVRLITSDELVNIIAASSGFTLPRGLDKSDSPTLFLTGAKEMRLVHRWAAELAQAMPNGVDRVAIRMRHDWPLGHPDLFSRTVDGWLNGAGLPPEIAPPRSGRS